MVDSMSSNKGSQILSMLREKGLEFEVSRGSLNVGVREKDFIIYPNIGHGFSAFVLSGVWMITGFNKQGTKYEGQGIKVEVYRSKFGVWEDYTFYSVDLENITNSD